MMRHRLTRARYRHAAPLLLTVATVRYRFDLLRDALMIRFWPYDRYPGEWRQLFSRHREGRRP